MAAGLSHEKNAHTLQCISIFYAFIETVAKP